MDSNIVTIIVTIILSAIGFFIGYQMLRLEKTETGKNGWRLVCADFWPVGWGKMTGGVLKNHIPVSWRN